MQKLTTIYIARHGLSEANVQKVIAGVYDTPLVKEGEEQARALAKKLKNVRLDAIFSSDLVRAKKTAEIVALEHKLAVKTSHLLRERNFASLEMKKEMKEVLKLFEEYEKLSYEKWLKHEIVEGAETSEQIISRFITFLREAAVAYRGKTLLVISHGSMMRSLLVHLGFGPHDKLFGTIKNTAYVKLETDGIDFFIRETSGIVVPA